MAEALSEARERTDKRRKEATETIDAWIASLTEWRAHSIAIREKNDRKYRLGRLARVKQKNPFCAFMINLLYYVIRVFGMIYTRLPLEYAPQPGLNGSADETRVNIARIQADLHRSLRSIQTKQILQIEDCIRAFGELREKINDDGELAAFYTACEQVLAGNPEREYEDVILLQALFGKMNVEFTDCQVKEDKMNVRERLMYLTGNQNTGGNGAGE